MFLPEVTHANTSNLDEVKAERQEIKSKLSDKEKEIVEVLEEIEDLHKNIVEIEDALKANQEQMNDAEETIEQYETEIAEIQKEIDQLNDEIEKRNDILRSKIASYQENGGNLSFLNVLLGANDFNDFISIISAFNRIAEAESEIIEKQKQDQALVIEHQNEIKEKLEEQEEIM